MSRSQPPASSTSTLTSLILGQPVRQRATGRAGADDDIIDSAGFHVAGPRSAVDTISTGHSGFTRSQRSGDKSSRRQVVLACLP